MTVSETVLFVEPGGRWRTIAYGPALCLLILVVELSTGSPAHWFALIFCGALIAGFVTLQVVAARRHISVELTADGLRNGTETVPLEKIAAVFAESDERRWSEDEWENARALGELTGVPRRRTGIGLRCTDGGLVRAWAKDHRGLRAALNNTLAAAGTDTRIIEASPDPLLQKWTDEDGAQ